MFPDISLQKSNIADIFYKNSEAHFGELSWKIAQENQLIRN